MAKKTIKKKKRDVEYLWRKAIKQDDIQLAIDAARFLGDHERLVSIAIEGWLKKQYEICEQAFRAQEIELSIEGCSQLEKLLKEANGKRKSAILNIQDIFNAIVEVHSSKSGIVFKRSYATDSGLTVCMAMRMEEIIAICIQKARARCIPLEDAEEEWQVEVIPPMPDEIWPSYFKTWDENIEKNYDNCYKWAMSKIPNLFLPLLPQEKIVLETPTPKKKSPPKKAKLSFFEKVLEAIEKEGWDGLCKKTTRGQKQFLQFSKDELSQITKKLQDVKCIYRLENKPLKKFPLYFAKELCVNENTEECQELANSDFLKNVRCLGIGQNTKSEVIDSLLEGSGLKNVEEIYCSYYDLSIKGIKASPWLKTVKKIYLGTSGFPQEFDNSKLLQQQVGALLSQCPAVEHLSISYLKVNRVLIGSAKLPKLRSFSFTDLAFSGVEALLKAMDTGTIKEIRSHYGCSPTKALVKLLKSPKLEGITKIKFEGLEGVDQQVAKAIAQNKHLSSLQRLTICSNWRGRKGVVEAIAVSPYLKNLRYLDLSRSSFGSEAIIALANSPNLANVETLFVHDNAIGDAGFIALETSPYTKKLQELDSALNGITTTGLKFLDEESFPALRRLLLWNNKKLNTITAAKCLAQWPRLAELELLNVHGSLSKKGRELLCSSDYLQGVKLEGVPEYQGFTNWRKIKKDDKEEIDDCLQILATRQEIVEEVQKQISIWAGKFKINLDFTKLEENSDSICISMTEIGNSIFKRVAKDTHSEPQISDREYAIALLEEAKRKIADKHQEQITKIFFENVK